MPTTQYGYVNDSVEGGDLGHAQINLLGNGLEEERVTVAGILAPSGGFLQATDYNASVIAATMAVTVSAGKAYIGSVGNTKLIASSVSQQVGAGNVDGEPVGSGGGTTNYFFLRKDGTWHIDQDNSPPAGIDSELAFTAVFSATEATSVDNAPSGRTNMGSLEKSFQTDRDTTLADGTDIAVGTSTGTKIGTAAAQKLSLWGATPVIQPAAAGQAAVTLGNVDNEIGGLVISDPPTQAEVQALRDKCEELADDVRALSTLIHAMRTGLVNAGILKGSA